MYLARKVSGHIYVLDVGIYVPSQESQRSYICVRCRGINLSFFYDLSIEFWNRSESCFFILSFYCYININRVVVVICQLYLQLPITTKDVSWNPAHCEVYFIQYYVIKFASDLGQVGGVLRFCPPMKLTTTITTEIVLTFALNTTITTHSYVVYIVRLLIHIHMLFTQLGFSYTFICCLHSQASHTHSYVVYIVRLLIYLMF